MVGDAERDNMKEIQTYVCIYTLSDGKRSLSYLELVYPHLYHLVITRLDKIHIPA